MSSDIPFAKLTLADCARLPEFKPSDLGLPDDFVLTSFAELKG